MTQLAKELSTASMAALRQIAAQYGKDTKTLRSKRAIIAVLAEPGRRNLMAVLPYIVDEYAAAGEAWAIAEQARRVYGKWDARQGFVYTASETGGDTQTQGWIDVIRGLD